MVKTRVVAPPDRGASLPVPSTAVGRTTGREERLSLTTPATARSCWAAAAAEPGALAALLPVGGTEALVGPGSP